MVKPELFLGQVQQVLKQRVTGVPQRDHEPPPGFPRSRLRNGKSRSDSCRKASMELFVLLPMAHIPHQFNPHVIEGGVSSYNFQMTRYKCSSGSFARRLEVTILNHHLNYRLPTISPYLLWQLIPRS